MSERGIKILGDGTALGTRIIVDGHEVHGVERLEVVIDASTGRCSTALHFAHVDLEIDAPPAEAEQPRVRATITLEGAEFTDAQVRALAEVALRRR